MNLYFLPLNLLKFNGEVNLMVKKMYNSKELY